MEQTIEELAEDIIKTIEREDFIHALKHYGGFIAKTTAKDFIKWWNKV